MANQSNNSPVVSKVMQDAEIEIKTFDSSPFSSQGFSTLKEKISEYIAQLITESIKVSKRHRADTVSVAHVERADEYIVASSNRRIFRHLGTVGGILLGAALSNSLSMATSAQISKVGFLIAVGFGIVGASLVALHIAKE